MRRCIPFNYFEPDQDIYFDIDRLELLEAMTGTTVTKMAVDRDNTGIGFVKKALAIGLAHHYTDTKLTAEKIGRMIEKHLDNGGTLSQLELAVGKAIIASGIYGKTAADRAIGLIPDPEDEETEGKNVPAAEGE